MANLKGGSIYSDSSNYDMLNNSIFNVISDTNIELDGGYANTDFTQISDFNIDKLFETDNNINDGFSATSTNRSVVEGIFSPTSPYKNISVRSSEIEKIFRNSIEESGNTDVISEFDLNKLIGGGSEGCDF